MALKSQEKAEEEPHLTTTPWPSSPMKSLLVPHGLHPSVNLYKAPCVCPALWQGLGRPLKS